MAIETVKRAVKRHSSDDETIQWCMERLVDIASGSRRGRYIGDEYRAIVQLLDRTKGKPTEQQKHSGEITHRVVIEEADDGAG